MGLRTAVRAFLAAWGSSPRAQAVRRALDEPLPPALPAPVLERESSGQRGGSPAGSGDPTSRPPAARSAPAKPEPSRSDALSLLAALQRESRLLDLIQEPLHQYTDAQVGAAARDCLEKCRGTVERMFGLRPAIESAEGAVVEIPPQASPARYQWVGTTGQSLQRGRVVHPGWEAARCEVPQWTGGTADRSVVAPAQIEGT